MNRPLHISREPGATEVVRAPNGNTQWNTRRSTAYVFQFCELAPEVLQSPRIVVAGRNRVFPGPMHPRPPNSVVLVSFQDGLYVNDGAAGTRAPDAATRGGGTQIGPIYMRDVISSPANQQLRLVEIARAWGIRLALVGVREDERRGVEIRNMSHARALSGQGQISPLDKRLALSAGRRRQSCDYGERVLSPNRCA